MIVCAGPRATQTRLLADLRPVLDEARENPALLSSPVLVIVRSRALRDHVASLIARELGPAVLGLSVQTLQSTAADILRACREPLALESGLASVLERRHAAGEEALREALEEFDDGYGVAAAAMRDFQSAGLGSDEKVLQSVVAAIVRAPGRAKDKARAEAVARASAETARAMERLKIGRQEDRVERAARLLEARGASALHARAIFIHGYSDATGKATRILRALLSVCGARLYVDEPPDPVSTDSGDRITSFVRRLRGRVQDVAEAEQDKLHGKPAEVAAFNASGADAEIREVGRRIHALLESGTRPERIGITGRRIGEYLASIRREFGDLGIPCGGEQLPQSFTPRGRRAIALTRLLEDGMAASLDTWLQAGAVLEQPRELVLGLRSLGAVRLSQLVALDLEEIGAERGLALPLREGLVPRAGDESGPLQAQRVRLGARSLRDAQRKAAGLKRLLEKWPESAKLREHATHVRGLLDPLSGWNVVGENPDDPSVAEQLARLPGQDETLTREEFLQLLGSLLESVGAEPLGGSGGGVRVIDTNRAGGLTFDHLFVVGLNSGTFPRTVTEDPIVEDSIRNALLEVLPDLSIKRRGYDEEAYLFAQFLDAAPRVTLSWQRSDSDGKVREISPFLERLIIERPGMGVPAKVPRLESLALGGEWAGGEHRPRTARESLRLAALSGTRAQWAALLLLALGDRASVAGARLAILEEKDPSPITPEGKRRLARLGPWSGFLPPVRDARDPRAGAMFVTRLESIASCPWRAFLGNVLRVDAAPDPAGAPELEQRLIGQVVHQVLEQIVAGESEEPASLKDALARGPREIARPPRSEVLRLTELAAREQALRNALSLPGMHRTLAERSLPYVQRAIEIDWPSEDTRVSVVGSELRVDTFIDDHRGERRTISFRADRIDLQGGRLILTDYKTGKPVSDKVRPETRLKHLRAAVADGRRLQVAAYARTAHEGEVEGRYLFIDRALHVEHAEAALQSDDPVVSEGFPKLAALLFQSSDEGVAFPRVEDAAGNAPVACGYCEYRTACVQGERAEHERLRNAVLSEGGSTLSRLWWLGGAPEEAEGESS